MFQLYSFGDTGKLDDNNPFYYFDKAGCKKLLLDLAYKRPVDESPLLKDLMDIGMVNKDKTLNFPFFIKSDVKIIQSYSKNIAKRMYSVMEKCLDKFYDLVDFEGMDRKEVLYHFLCCDILDGSALDIYGKKGYFSLDLPQKDNRRYLLIGFEDDKEVLSLSEGLLCSCNVHHHDKIEFKSFGDAKGDRNDVYRFLRQQEYAMVTSQSKTNVNQAYLEIIRDEWVTLMNRAYDVIVNNHQDKKFMALLEALEYMKHGEVCVPVFTTEHRPKFNELTRHVIQLLEPIVAEAMDEIDGLKLSAVEHGVSKKAIGNEMWHQIFGELNELLVLNDVVKQPEYREGEGRYLKAIYIKE